MSTTAANSRKPKKVEVVIVNDEVETPSLLNPMSGQIFVTNPVGKRLMELADGTRSVEQIGDELSREFKGAQRSEMISDAAEFYEQTHRKGLLTWTD